MNDKKTLTVAVPAELHAAFRMKALSGRSNMQQRIEALVAWDLQIDPKGNKNESVSKEETQALHDTYGVK